MLMLVMTIMSVMFLKNGRVDIVHDDGVDAECHVSDRAYKFSTVVVM